MVLSMNLPVLASTTLTCQLHVLIKTVMEKLPIENSGAILSKYLTIWRLNKLWDGMIQLAILKSSHRPNILTFPGCLNQMRHPNWKSFYRRIHMKLNWNKSSAWLISMRTETWQEKIFMISSKKTKIKSFSHLLTSWPSVSNDWTPSRSTQFSLILVTLLIITQVGTSHSTTPMQRITANCGVGPYWQLTPNMSLIL